jgi:hypothetical protein
MKMSNILKRFGQRAYASMKKHPILSATAIGLGTAILTDQLIDRIFDYSFFDSIYNTMETIKITHGYASAESGTGENYSVNLDRVLEYDITPDELSMLKESGNTVAEQGEMSLPNYMEGENITANATSETAGNKLANAIEPSSNEDVFIVKNRQTLGAISYNAIASKIAVLTSAYHAFDEARLRLKPAQEAAADDIPNETPAKKVTVLRTYTFDVEGNVIKIQNH